MYRPVIVLFKSKLSFRISASVTTLVVVSACPPINRFPFDCFFFFSNSFCLMPRQSPLFLRRPIFGCANTAHCHGARALAVLHLASLLQGLLGSERTLFRPIILSYSLFALPRYPFPFTLRAGFKYAKRLFFLAASASSLVWSAAPT